ncbi:T9SS type A sorting domain-containing protein, partial [candidate division WOR-3 bacterium]|nr:T9SS type A sorting domain-containing protein [candidate division WOR-3 bacterium]
MDRTVIGEPGVGYGYSDPSCAFGWHTFADSFTVGVAWVCSTPQGYRGIRFRRNRANGIYQGWLSTEYFTAPANCQDTRPSLKMTHNGYPSGVITFERKDTVGTDDMNLCEFYTYDGGRNWTCDTLYVPGITQNRLNCLSVDDSLGDYHVFFKGSTDDIRYKEAHYDDFSQPGGWTGSIPISDGGNISDAVSPASAVRDGEPCVCWKIFVSGGNDTLKFDALWLQTGVEEEPIEEISTTPFSLTPNPSNGIAMLSYTVEREGNVKISLHDITGRTIKNLLDENKGNGRYSLEINNKELPSGIYFVHIKTSDGVYTKSMTV